METGIIHAIVDNRGFGFIRTPGGTSHFFHASQTRDFPDLAVGDRVAFDIARGRDGRPQAVNVRVI